MLKVERKANGDVVFTVGSRLAVNNVSELSALLAAEPPGHWIARAEEPPDSSDSIWRNCESE